MVDDDDDDDEDVDDNDDDNDDENDADDVNNDHDGDNDDDHSDYDCGDYDDYDDCDDVNVAFQCCCKGLCKCCQKEEIIKEEFSFLALGLDGAGKSTLLSKLCGEINEEIEPTKGTSYTVCIKAILYE